MKPKVADAIIELLPQARDVPDAEKPVREIFAEGLRAAVIAARDICKRYDPEADVRERRLVSDTAGWLTRAGIRVMEGDFRARQSDRLNMLLEELAVITRQG